MRRSAASPTTSWWRSAPPTTSPSSPTRPASACTVACSARAAPSCATFSRYAPPATARRTRTGARWNSGTRRWRSGTRCCGWCSITSTAAASPPCQRRPASASTRTPTRTSDAAQPSPSWRRSSSPRPPSTWPSSPTSSRTLLNQPKSAGFSTSRTGPGQVESCAIDSCLLCARTALLHHKLSVRIPKINGRHTHSPRVHCFCRTNQAEVYIST